MISAITLKEIKTFFNVLVATEGMTFEAFISSKLNAIASVESCHSQHSRFEDVTFWQTCF
ncbi:hypothetical protein ACE1CI_36335 [Aerosakkonemataceae cyanobacterium BLCC-F50]|uniref:Uncharacterized protein n=1 Tax=Floridaenema flaviceps BLCC-F50 TaxID=3153642 RepID=A0ABV4Y3D7_9CYAN